MLWVLMSKRNLGTFEKKNIVTKNLLAKACYVSNANIVVNFGVIQLKEVSLEHPLQWIICMLLIIKLPVYHWMYRLPRKLIFTTYRKIS